MKTIYILAGMPGSGKGTQADWLREQLDLELIQVGALLRAHVDKGTALGMKVKPFIERGELAPNQLVDRIIFTKIKQSRGSVLLDGYPRHPEQSKKLIDYVRENKLAVKTFEIVLPEDLIMERISGRLSCQCGESYHVIYNPPLEKNICNKCGQKLFVRADSRPEVVKNRIAIYNQQTKAALEYLQQAFPNDYYTIDGRQTIQEINQQLTDITK